MYLAPTDLARTIDHTILKPAATAQEVEKVCAEALEHGFATVCVNSVNLVRVAASLHGSSVRPCVVIGFPLGACATSVKVYEAQWAVDHGAAEVDMVLDLGGAVGLDSSRVAADVRAVQQAVHRGGGRLKVILETGFLSSELLRHYVRLSAEEGADFVKTSTGFGPRGASLEDVATMADVLRQMQLSDRCLIKASGGIRTLREALAYLDAGAHRLGTSAGVAIMDEMGSCSSTDNLRSEDTY